MLLRNKRCADAGTVNCPCRLAEYRKCIVCSRLRNGENGHDATPAVCDCDWQGVCVYNEYMQNINVFRRRQVQPEKGQSGCGAGEQRKSQRCEIQKIKWYSEDLVVMRVAVPYGIAVKAALPGSFVFVRAPGMENFFDFPLSVLKSDYENAALELAVKVAGPKSIALIKGCLAGTDNALPIDDTKGGEYGSIELRGLYRNGLLGAEKLISPGPKKVLCLTRGVGLAPAANYIRWADGRDEIDVIADLENVTDSFAEYALDGCKIRSVRYGSLPLGLSWADEEKYDVIVISASDYYQQNIYVPASKKVLSNNNSMCCGEGICGACICIETDGVPRRMCKSCEI